MWKLGLGIVIFQRKGLGLLWACELAHSCSQQNTVIYWGKLSCKTLIPHTPLIRGWGGGRKSSLSELNWAFTSFHGHKGQMPLSHQCWPWWDHQGLYHSFLSTHNPRTAVLWSENVQEKENVKEVSSVISFQRGERKRTGHCIWILRTKPETQCNRLLWATHFCSLHLSQHHWPLHFVV